MQSATSIQIMVGNIRRKNKIQSTIKLHKRNEHDINIAQRLGTITQCIMKQWFSSCYYRNDVLKKILKKRRKEYGDLIELSKQKNRQTCVCLFLFRAAVIDHDFIGRIIRLLRYQSRFSNVSRLCHFRCQTGGETNFSSSLFVTFFVHCSLLLGLWHCTGQSWITRVAPFQHKRRATFVQFLQARNLQFKQLPHIRFANKDNKDENSCKNVQYIGRNPDVRYSTDPEGDNLHHPWNSHKNKQTENHSEPDWIQTIIQMIIAIYKKQMDSCCLLLFSVVAAGGESCVDTCSIKEYNRHHEEDNVAENQHGHRSVQISQKRFTSFIKK